MRRWLPRLLLLALAGLAACAPVVRPAGPEIASPALDGDVLVMADGESLALQSWLPAGEPAAVILALHGYNDYANAFAMPAEAWAARGIATYAYDQRGFGRSDMAGLWAGAATLVADVGTAIELLRARHPGVPLVLLGESMGGAVAILALGKVPPPPVDAAVLVAPAVWGGDTMPWPWRASLWLVAHLFPGMTLSGRGLDIWPSDNIEMLRALSADPLVIKESRADAVLGLVRLMDAGLGAAGPVAVPLLLVYGENDQVVPPEPVDRFVRRLAGPVRVATYEEGYHMLLRDLARHLPVEDIAAFALDPKAALPSRADDRAGDFFGEPSADTALAPGRGPV